MYLTMTTETEPETSGDHEEADEELARVLRERAGLGELGEVVDEAKMRAARVEVCSCGYFTCGMISRYGLPVPTFKEDVEPLWPQARRDERALQIRGCDA
jgi:hypothetical protein